MTFLSDPHRAKLRSCGLTAETIDRAGLHSGSEAQVRDILGYGGAGTGLVIPYDEHYARVRIDHPGPDGKRYRSPKGPGNRLYVPKILDPTALADPTIPLYVTEGEFKALKAVQEGFPCVALPGVWSWKTRLHGQSFPIPDLGRVEWKGRTSILVFDSDAEDKPPVAWAEHALCQELRGRGGQVYVIRLPEGPRGEKYGLDDYLVAHGPEAFRRLEMRPILEADEGVPTFLRVTDLADAYLLALQRPDARIHTGYEELDGILRGIAPGEVMQILGRSGVGKTAFALNLIERMTADGEIPTLFFSLEQQGTEIFERMASLTSGWPGREIEERARIEDPQAIERLLEVCARWKHVITVEKPCSLAQLDALLEAAQKADLWKAPLRLVVVDYVGMIGQDRQQRRTLYEHVSEVARELKRLAKRYRVALVSLCQVGREGESGGEPVTLRSGRDSGVLEEAADYLLGIWRPELKDGLPKEKREELRGQFKVRVLKNRSGPAPKTVTLQFDPTSLRVRRSGGDEGDHGGE